MAEVVVTLRVMPDSVEADLDIIESQIKTIVKPEKIHREPIAFGLVALNVVKIIPDASGELEAVENKIRSIKNIGEVEVMEVSRL